MTEQAKQQEQDIVVEKDVPIPPRSRRTKYPWRSMEIGDSFFAKIKDTSAGPLVQQAQKSTGFLFTTRRVDGGVRIWRIK